SGTRLSFFLHGTSPPAIYSLSLHDALPIFTPSVVAPLHDVVQLVVAVGAVLGLVQPFRVRLGRQPKAVAVPVRPDRRAAPAQDRDRKSTRLNSSHQIISYAVFCLNKKKHQQ